MKSFWPLLKASFNTYYGVSAMRFRWFKQKKGLWEPLLILFGVVVGFGTLASQYWNFLNASFDSLWQLGQESAILTQGFVAGMMLTVVFGAAWVIAAFYFAKDLTVLIPLPLSGGSILTAKFLTVLSTEYLTLFLATAPPMAVYGLRTGAGPAYWLMAVITFLLTPVIPLVIASLFAVILMRVVAPKRGRDIFTIIGSLFGLVIFGLVQYMQQASLQGVGSDQIMRILAAPDGLVQMTGRFFPPTIWASLAMAHPFQPAGLGGLALLLGWTILALMALYLLADRYFLPALLSGAEVAKKKSLTEGQMTKQMVEQSQIQALFRRELRLFNRNPSWLMNTLLAIFLVPVALAMPFISGPAAGDFGEILKLPRIGEILTLVIAAFMIFETTIQTIAVTAISREGKELWIIRSLPIEFGQLLRAKAYHAIVMALIAAIPVLGLVAFFLHLPVVSLLLGVLLGVVGFVPFVLLGLLIDLYNPYLDWTNAQQVMKKNLNALFYTLGCMVLLGVLVIPTTAMFAKGWSFTVIYGALLVGLALIGALLTLLLMRVGEKLYSKIE
ncbi:MAG: putative ABC transporter permease subunit [Bacillota bacterium]